jgi:acyl dehydratase
MTDSDLRDHAEDTYFEDIEPGHSFIIGEHTCHREEMVEFARKWDPQPFHVDEDAAEHPAGDIFASSSYTMSVVTKLIGENLRIKTLGLMELNRVRIHAPVRPGDHLTVTAQWLDKRESRTKHDRGIVHSSVDVRNQHDEPVLSYTSTIMVVKRGDV